MVHEMSSMPPFKCRNRVNQLLTLLSLLHILLFCILVFTFVLLNRGYRFIRGRKPTLLRQVTRFSDGINDLESLQASSELTTSLGPKVYFCRIQWLRGFVVSFVMWSTSLAFGLGLGFLSLAAKPRLVYVEIHVKSELLLYLSNSRDPARIITKQPCRPKLEFPIKLPTPVIQGGLICDREELTNVD